MKTKERKDPITIGTIQRYVLIGAAIGLYYGLFYQPSATDPDYGIAIILSLVAAAVTVAIRFWKKKAPFSIILKSFVETFLFYSVLLLTLAVRQFAQQVGGRFGVILVTTLVGIGMGYVMATRKKVP